MSAWKEQRAAHLRAAAQLKSEEAHSKARRAIIALENRGMPVNFRTVAEEAGVSRDFLYRSAEIRQQIADRRRQPALGVNASGLTVRKSEASAAVKLAVAIQALQRLKEENRRLRDENAKLLGDLSERRRNKG